MKQTFTNNDLVKYIYKETSLADTLAIQEALLVDGDLFESYQNLMEGYIELPKATFAPTTSALQNILNYSSRALAEA